MSAIRSQLILLVCAVCFSALASVSLIPDPSELSVHLSSLIARSGYPLIALASLLENFVAVGGYFPGSIAIAAAMAASGGDPQRGVLTYVSIVVPAIISNLASYWYGRRTRTAVVTLSSKMSSLALIGWYTGSYWHPQTAALAAAASGARGIPLKRYLKFFLPISISWSVLWAVVLYHVGRALPIGKLFLPIFYLYLVGWSIVDLRAFIRNERQTAANAARKRS